MLRRLLLLFLLLSLPICGWSQSAFENGGLVVAGKFNSCSPATASGTTYACNLDWPITQYSTGAYYSFKADVANTGAATINYNGAGARTIKKLAGNVTTDLVAGDICVSQMVVMLFDGTNMQLVSPRCTGPDGGTVRAQDYGVVCNGSTDTTTALQAAVNAAIVGTQGLTLAMPAGGTCKLSSTITIASVVGFTMQGNGVVFTWAGTNTIPMFLLQDAREAVLEHFQVQVSTSAPVLNVIQIENGAGSTVVSTHNTVRHVTIECTNGGCTNALRMAQGAGGDANNDFHVFQHLMIANPAGACARIEHAQSKSHAFEDMNCALNGIGSYVIRTNPSGSFTCMRCSGGGATVADFSLADADDFVVIRDSNFEGSKRLLETGGPSGVAFPVTIASTRWSLNGLHADKQAIRFLFPGPLVLLNNLFEPATAGQATELYWQNDAGGALLAVGNMIASTLATPFTYGTPTFAGANLIDRNNGAGPVPLLGTVTSSLQVSMAALHAAAGGL